MKEHIISYLNTVYPLSAELVADLHILLKPVILGKKEVYHVAGQVCNSMSFVVKGFLRSYYINDAGEQITNWFMKEGDVITLVKSFYQRRASEEYLAAIEPSTLLYITYNELKELYRKYPEFNIIGRLLTEKYYVQAEERIQILRHVLAEERYKNLINLFPFIAQRAPVMHIASYLGMNKDTLSRIRRLF